MFPPLPSRSLLLLLRYTYMDEWGIPSGGDWGLHRGGAVFVEGAEGITVDACEFTLLDGNAFFLSGYTRNVTVANSSFSYIGDNAMAAWGYTEDIGANGESGEEGEEGVYEKKGQVAAGGRLPVGTGIDGTGGEQPRFTKIHRNVVREIGMNERQSSAWSEAKACLSEVTGNLFYNMPRAAININDGFGGGTVVDGNLLFNTCRESGDHGPINSWDRQPFLTKVRNGSASLVPAFNHIRKNFLWSNYGAGFGVDNDDTSSYYRIYENFFYLGGGVKCDYDGHEKHFYDNVMLGTSAGCWHTCAYKKGFPDYCYNNTLVQRGSTQSGGAIPYAIIWFCDAKNVSHVVPDYSNEVQMGKYIHSNRIFNDVGAATVTCGYSGSAADTTVSLSAFTSAGLMEGTTVGKTPPTSTVLAWAKTTLGMPGGEPVPGAGAAKVEMETETEAKMEPETVKTNGINNDGGIKSSSSSSSDSHKMNDAEGVEAPPVLAQRPPMGFSTWNFFPFKSIDEATCTSLADALHSTGLVAAGYTMFMVDEPCFTGRDNTTLALVENATAWPHGLKSFSDHISSLGMNLGIYTGEKKEDTRPCVYVWVRSVYSVCTMCVVLWQ